MPGIVTGGQSNRLIESLSRKDRKRMLQSCESVDLVFGEILCEPRRRVRHAYFPLTGFISLVSTIAHHPPLEMGLIGSEGMLGATLVLGINTAPLRAVVQGKGTALRITALQLRRQLRDCPSLPDTLQRCLYVLMGQLAKATACNHFHKLEPRLARWLLMTHDRAHGDHFHLTHEYLAGMLGVRRSGITVAAGSLQRRNFIHYARGEITILDRKGLETACCACYEGATEDYAHLLK